jgi:O-antigen/teichoic acid export membrane protein
VTLERRVPRAKRLLASLHTIALRIVSLFSRFLLMFYLARNLRVEEMGEYGLTVAAIEIVAFSLGFEFYAYSTREMICHPVCERPRMLRDQLVVHALTYALFAPIVAILVSLGVLRGSQALLFSSIVATEYMAQESSRLLVALSYPALATFQHFIRSSAWIYPVIAVMWFAPEERNLTTVWIGWLAGSAASLLIPVWLFRQLDWGSIANRGIGWGWIRHGMRAALVYFASSLFLRLGFILDRVILEAMQGLAAVGVYIFFLGIANVLTVLVESGVDIHYYPRLVKVFREGPKEDIFPALRSFLLALASTLVATITAMALAITPFLDWLDRATYRENLEVFWWLLAAMAIWCASLLPGYILWAKGYDKRIMIASGCHVAIFAAAAIPLCYTHGAVGIAMAQLLASFASLLLKTTWIYTLSDKFPSHRGSARDIR